MADDLMTALRALANRWTMKARDYARASKEAGSDEAQASYNRGFAEGYYKAATELATVIKELESGGNIAPRSAPARPPAPPQQQQGPSSTQQGGRRTVAPTPLAPPAAPKPPSAPIYISVSVGEAVSILEFAGTSVRDVVQNKDNSFRAIFSRWENMMPHERIERIQKADARIIILGNGKLEGNDQYVDFAFKES